MKFDERRSVDLVMLLLVALAAAKFLLDIEQVQDIQMGDESRYLQSGVDLLREGIRDPSWSPLYSVWYFVLSPLEADKVKLYYLNYRVLVVAATVLFFLLVRALRTDLYVSALATIWLLLSTVTSAWPYNGLFAVVLVLACLNLMVRVPQEDTSYLILGLTIAALVFVRSEFLISLILLPAALLLSWRRKRRRLGVDTGMKCLAFAAGVAALFWVFGNPMSGNKAWAAFGGHYSINYVRRHGLDMVPWFDWPEIMRMSFGDATSPWTAALNNSEAFATHVVDNVLNYALTTIAEPLMAPLPFLPPRTHGALAFLQLCLLIGMGLFLARRIADDRDVVSRVFPRRVVVAGFVLYLSTLFAALFYYPRWHYLSVQTSLFLAGGAVLFSRVVERAVVRVPSIMNVLIFGAAVVAATPNAVWGWLPGREAWSPERTRQIASRRFSWSLPSPTVFMNYMTGGPLLTPWHADAVVPAGILETRAVIDTVRSLRIEAPVVFLAFLDPYRVYLGDNYRDVKHQEKIGTPFFEFLEQQEINMIWVCDKLTNSQGYVDDVEFRDFLENPGGHGFRRIEIPTVDSWLLVKTDLQ